MIPSSGAVDFGTIQTDFGGSNPIGLNEYYSGSISNLVGGNVPASGTISLNNFRGSNAGKGYAFGSFTTPITCKAQSINFNTEVVEYCSTAVTGSGYGLFFVNSSTKAHQMMNSGSSSFAMAFLTEVSETISSSVTATGLDTQTTANSSTAGYYYFGSYASAYPSLPVLRTTISKFTFATQVYSTASGSTPQINYTGPSTAQSSTKAYAGGSIIWTGDVNMPTYNFSGALRILTFSTESAATSGNSLTGNAGTATGANSSSTGYFLGRTGGPVSPYYDLTYSDTINSLNFSNDTCTNPGVVISFSRGGFGATNSKTKIYYSNGAGPTYAYNFTNNTNATVSTGTYSVASSWAAQSYSINP